MMWNLVNLHEYGLSYDEPAGMGRGEETARLFRSLTTGGEVPPNLTAAAPEYHPGFYAFVNYQIARWLTRQGLDPIAAGHVLNVLVAALGLGIVYLLAGRLYGGWVGLWAVLFLALYPRFVAHAHYNGKDVPVMVFTLLTIYLLYLAHERRRGWLWCAAGVALGVAINAKLEALLVLPMLLGCVGGARSAQSGLRVAA
jgi:4-amino-4-deoxy-L-arabinose transferase-like glycosyltransferase